MSARDPRLPRRVLRRLFVQPATPSVVALAAFGVGMLVARLGSGHDTRSREFAATQEFDVWSVAIGAVMAVSALVLGWLWRTGMAWDRASHGMTSATVVLAYLVFAAGVLLTLVVAGPPFDVPLYLDLWRVRGVLAAALFGAMPGVAGLWLVHARLRVISATLRRYDQRHGAAVLADLRDTWSDAQRCLGGIGMIITVGVIATGAQRNALLANGLDEAAFPSRYVVLYGLFFTVVLAAVYVPTLLSWRRRAEVFVDAVYPTPLDARFGQDWVDGRGRLATVLRLDVTLAKTLGAGLGVLAPLGTSVGSLFLGT